MGKATAIAMVGLSLALTGAGAVERDRTLQDTCGGSKTAPRKASSASGTPSKSLEST